MCNVSTLALFPLSTTKVTNIFSFIVSILWLLTHTHGALDSGSFPDDSGRTIRDAILTYTQQLTWVSLIYCSEPKIKKQKKLKSKKRICSGVSVNSPGNPWSQSWRRKGGLKGWCKNLRCSHIISMPFPMSITRIHLIFNSSFNKHLLTEGTTLLLASTYIYTEY